MDGLRSGGGRNDAQTDDVLAQLSDLQSYVKSNRSRINAIEERMATFEQPRRTFSLPDPTAQSEITDDTEMTRDYMYLSVKKTIPQVRECTFAEFKNRFDPRGKDGRFAVDALVSGPLLHQEIQEEHRLRNKLFDKRGPSLMTRVVKDKALAKAVKMAANTTELISQAQAEEKWPRRLRIQSPALLQILARVNREKWSNRPRTYHRPFNSLIYQHREIKEVLEDLEERWGAQLDGNVTPAEDDESVGTEGDEESVENIPDESEDSVHDSPQALACLRAYVKYVDDEIMPDYYRFEKQDEFSNATVRFSDLWYLFRTGELVYRPVDGEQPDQRDFRTGKRIWKTYFVDPVPERLLASATDDEDIRDTAASNDDAVFSVGCYHVDYAGDDYCVVKKTFTIDQFSGDMPVSALPVYPMRFCRDSQNRLEHAKTTGEALVQFIQTKHCYYSGWTLILSPSGDPTTDVNGDLLQQPEHINSEVMVDFTEAFQACPSWRPQRASMRQKIPEGLTVQEDFRIRWWSGPDRAILLGETTELLPVKSGVTAKQRNRHVTQDPFLVAVSENAKHLQHTTDKHLTEDVKALLTGRVYAYVFQERKFAQLAVEKLRPSPKTGLALDLLKIPQSVKHAIQGSIKGHFIQKKAEQRIDQNWVSLDLIQGKGTGLFILLHGVPGVGKTATAEAIAQANGKPLFKMTVGDLGMTPETLEVSLRDIFRLASIWDCILLLDEVDTFFSARSRADSATNKNALVSVFLRVLDYYNGILFLTTNRAGVLDEAFKSRIHYKIYYPDLTLEQTLDIWTLNIQRVRKIEEELAKVEERESLQINENDLINFARRRFVEGDVQRRKHGRWNGRQIRNAFQVARSLAYYEYHMRKEEQGAPRPSSGRASVSNPPVGPPTLDVRHFETMHEITASFENYRTAVHGGTTDAELALESEYRNDRYRDSLTEKLQAQYREDHLGAAAVADVAVIADESGASPGDGTTTATVAVTGRVVQRPPARQHHNGSFDEGEPSPPVDPGPRNRPHRGSMGTRNRSGSYLSTGVNPTSSPTIAYDPQMHAQSRFQADSPRPLEYGNYLGSSRAGNQAQMYGSSPRNSYSNVSASAGGYRTQGQYGNEGGERMATTPRGPSPAIGDGGVPLRVGAEYGQQEYYGPSGNPFSSASREGLAVRRHGSEGWNASPGVQGYGNLHTVLGRESVSRHGQNPETDLYAEEEPFFA